MVAYFNHQKGLASSGLDLGNTAKFAALHRLEELDVYFVCT